MMGCQRSPWGQRHRYRENLRLSDVKAFTQDCKRRQWTLKHQIDNTLCLGCINARNQTESNTAGLMLRGSDLCFGESTDNRWFNLRQKQIGVSRTTVFEKHIEINDECVSPQICRT